MRWRGIARGCAILLAGVFVLLAVLVTALRFGVPDLQPHRDWLLRQFLPAGVTASAEHLGWRWQNYGLQLELDDVAFEQKGATSIDLHAKKLQLHCNPFLQFWKTHSCLAQLQ
ncbi:MAG: hypothetical protein PHV54_16330, partial [Tolumonas sp.]|nr:hypothetical protein [Tolumonas sp.]